MGFRLKEVTERWVKRPDGTREKVKLEIPYWALFINHKGHRQFKNLGTSKREAMAKAREIEAAVTAEECNDDAPRVAFKGYAESFLTRTKAARRDSTYRSYRNAVRNHLIPAFGDYALREITKTQVRDFLFSRIERKMEAGSVHVLRAVLSAILNAAVEEDLILTNPAAQAGKKLPPPAKRNSILSPEEAEALFAVLKKSFPDAYLPVLLGARGGLRVGEVLGIAWPDIDLEGKSLTVRRTFSNRVEGPTKNGKERTVPMSPEVEAAIRAHRAARSALELKTGNRSEWLFVSPTTEHPFCEEWISSRLRKALEAAGLPVITFHSLRHSFASHLLHSGAPGPLVRDLGGWADNSILDRYSHAVTQGRADVAKLDELGKTRKPAQT